MPTRFLMIAAMLAVGACQNAAEMSAIPKPGRIVKAQVLVVRQTNNDPLTTWRFPSAEALSAGLSARVDEVRAAKAADARELFLQWSARPADLWIVGPGAPTEAWLASPPPKQKDRRVILLGAEAPKGDLAEARFVTLDTAALERFRKTVCGSPAFGPRCAQEPPFEPHVAWTDLFTSLLDPKRDAVTRVDFFSTFLEVHPTSDVARDAKLAAAFADLRKTFMLGELAP